MYIKLQRPPRFNLFYKVNNKKTTSGSLNLDDINEKEFKEN